MQADLNEVFQYFVTQPDDFQINQYDNIEEKQEKTQYAWLDDLGWI